MAVSNIRILAKSKSLELYKSLWEECQKKRRRTITKGVVEHPILSKFSSKGQVDFIDMQSIAQSMVYREVLHTSSSRKSQPNMSLNLPSNSQTYSKKSYNKVLEVQSFSLDTDQQSFCYWFSALSIIGCLMPAQKFAVLVCLVVNVVMETMQLVLSQFKTFCNSQLRIE